MIALLLLLACDPETVREGSPEDVDLSGYATLEDVAALQATVDEQASRIEALEAAQGELPTLEVLTVSAQCGAGYQAAADRFDQPVVVLGAMICSPEDGGEICVQATVTTVESDGTYQPEGSFLLVVQDETYCLPSARVDFYYTQE